MSAMRRESRQPRRVSVRRISMKSYPGPPNSVNSSVPWPAPNVQALKCGRTVLPSVVSAWAGVQQDSYYSDGDTVDIPDGLNPPVYEGEREKKWYRPRRSAP